MTLEQQHNPILDIDLPEWPGLLIVGESVTVDQAAEIIVRTGHWPLCLNDKAWVQTVDAIVGLKSDDDIGDVPEAWKEHWRQRQEWNERHGILDVEYLYNSQVGSAYIGGAHGWCHWNGFIGCDSYNIGKWPSTQSVLEDWQKIAIAFPFLKLRCQLFNEENVNIDDVSSTKRALIQYNVSGGAVDVVPPEKIGPAGPPGPSLDMQLVGLFTNPRRERGCTPEMLKHAIEIVRGRAQ
jgi:hypothetical protein